MARLRVGDKVRDIWWKPDINRWDNTYILGIDWFELTAQPPQATVAIRGKHYKGVRFRLAFKSPVWIEQWK